jgi:hypothetical protein
MEYANGAWDEDLKGTCEDFVYRDGDEDLVNDATTIRSPWTKSTGSTNRKGTSTDAISASGGFSGPIYRVRAWDSRILSRLRHCPSARPKLVSPSHPAFLANILNLYP